MHVEMILEGNAKLLAPGNPFTLRAEEIRQVPFVIQSRPGEFSAGRTSVRLKILTSGNREAVTEELPLVGPFHTP
jgi:hypothetical protein